MSKLRETFSLDRFDSNNAQESGGIPLRTVTIETTSSQRMQNVQLIGTSEEVLEYGDLSGEVLAYARNLHASAVVEVGIVQSATFYPLSEIHPGDGYVKLGRLSSLAGTYLKSDTASTELEILLHEIAS